MANPALAESIRNAFSGKQTNRFLAVYMAGCTLAAISVWPGNTPMYFVRFGRAPSSFAIMSVVVILLTTFISARYAIQRIGNYYTMREWFLMTPVKPFSLLVGKVCGALIHGLVIGVLGLPFLIITAAPSGFSFSAAAAVCGSAVATGYTIRSAGLLILSFKDDNPLVSSLFMWGFVAALFVFTLNILPEWNPLLIISHVQESIDSVLFFVFRYTVVSIIMNIVAFGLLVRNNLRQKRRMEP